MQLLRGRFLYFAKVPFCISDSGVFNIACFAKVSLCTADHGVRKKGDSQDGPRWNQDGSRWSQDGPGWSQDASRWSQDDPRWSQDVRMCAPRKSKNSPRIAVTQISTSALALKAPLHLLPCGMQVRRPQQPQLTTRSLKAALGRR